MSIQNFFQTKNVPSEVLVNTFNFLTLKELVCVARTCSQWKDLTNQCEIKKKAFEDLIERRIVSRINGPNLKECYFISSMLEEPQATPRLVSKFIRGGADTFCALKAISIAKTLTSEQIIDALDESCPHSIIESIVLKMKEVPESVIIAAIRQGNVEILPLFLKNSSFSPEMLVSKCIDFGEYECAKLIFSLYPDTVISIDEVIRMTEPHNLRAEAFEMVLRQYLKRQGSSISFDTVRRIESIIDTRLKFHYIPHNAETEKIFELIAKAYVKTYEMNTFELLMGNFDVEVFIRDEKHPVMAAKLIQAVEQLSLQN
jgi:hypothetical protein